jgi:hypothetical protein
MDFSKELPNQGQAPTPFLLGNNHVLSDELRDLIRPLIIGAIQHKGVVAEEQVLGSVVGGLVAELPVSHARTFILAVMTELAARGEITKLTWKAEGVERTEYYPKGTMFRVTPENQIVWPGDKEALPLPLLGDNENATKDFIINTIKLGSPKSVIRHVLAAFCPQCGEHMEFNNHICKV